MRKNELINRLHQIKDMGFVKSLRKGSTGVGYTFEQLLGVDENNIPIPDVGGRLEIKATRKDSNSLITLFTFNNSVWLESQQNVIQSYGYLDKSKRRALKKALRVNSKGVLRISINEHSVELVDGRQGKVIARWDLYTIVGTFTNKLKKVLYVLADRKIDSNGNEEFFYNEAYILSNPNSEEFIKAFKNSEIAIDLRMHIEENGGVRNRGTAVRVNKKCLFRLYNNIEKVL